MWLKSSCMQAHSIPTWHVVLAVLNDKELSECWHVGTTTGHPDVWTSCMYTLYIHATAVFMPLPHPLWSLVVTMFTYGFAERVKWQALILQLVNVLRGKWYNCNARWLTLRGKLLHYAKWHICIFCRKSASCTRISAVLHALVALTSSGGSGFQLKPALPSTSLPNEEDEVMPITSYLCQWKVPKKWKESNLIMSAAVFEKHDYCKQKEKSQPNRRFWSLASRLQKN